MHPRRRLLAVAAVVLALAPATASTVAPASADPAVGGAAAGKLKYLRFFPKGQCTRFAYTKRPEIVNRGVERFRQTKWDGRFWAGNARKAGFPVDRKPRAGDIAVWGRNQAGAFATGHVGYVKRVFANGSIRVAEVNWKGSRKAGTRTVSKSVVRGLKFIHRR